jgi:hypothetical protein
MKDLFYKPAHIEFQVAHDGSNMPESFGKFETPEDMAKFLGANIIALNQALTANRHMDQKEKTELREELVDLMENIVPIFEKKLYDAEVALADAKKGLKDAEERYGSEIAKAKELASTAKRGLLEINLDEKYTFRIAYNGKYYFYTWIDGVLRLCLIRNIPEFEKQDLYNAMASNEEYIDREFAPKADKKGKK